MLFDSREVNPFDKIAQLDDIFRSERIPIRSRMPDGSEAQRANSEEYWPPAYYRSQNI